MDFPLHRSAHEAVAPALGVTLLLGGTTLFFHADRLLEAWLLDVLPSWLFDLSVAI